MRARLRKKIVSSIFSFGEGMDKRSFYARFCPRKYDITFRSYYATVTKFRKLGITVKIEINKKQDNEQQH